MGFFTPKMGGTGGQFHLVVSFRYTPDPGELSFWCQLLEQVSRILHDATDDKHSIGQVLLSPNSMGGQDADIWVWLPGVLGAPGVGNSGGARLWYQKPAALDISRDYTFFATILAHELCHYLYDLRDEYLRDLTDNGCQKNTEVTLPNNQASLMEAYYTNFNTRWKPNDNDPLSTYRDWATFFPAFANGAAVLQLGQPTEVCHPGNHDITTDTNQNIINDNQSCWTYIANDLKHNNIHYGLTVPGPGGPTLPPPTTPLPAVMCTELIPVQRFMLVVDRSGSMAGAKLDQLKVGANFWGDYVNAEEELGFVSYSETPNLDSAMSPVPAADPAASTWRAARHTIVDNLAAFGMTAIGDALRVGLNDILAGGRASSQVMILFTDGLQNAGAETAEQVLPDLIASGVRCYTIGLGNDQDATLLSNIATTTGARYFAIDGSLDPDHAAAAISEALIEIAGESRENGGIVSFQDLDGLTVEAITPNGEDAPPFLWAPKSRARGEDTRPRPLKSFRFPVEITLGSTHCTLGVLWKHTQQQFRIRVYDPDGNALGTRPGVRWVQGVYPYAFCEIDKPKEGTWHVEVHGADIRRARFRTIGFEINDRIRFEVSAVETHVRSGTAIRLRVRLLAPQAVPGVPVTGWVWNPGGTWRSFRFTEHRGGPGDREESFVYTASVPSVVERPGQYLIAVDAYRKKGTFEVKLDMLYRSKPGLRPEDLTRKVTVPRIRRRVFLTVTADREGRSSEEPLAGYNTKAPWIPRNQETLLEHWRASRSR